MSQWSDDVFLDGLRRSGDPRADEAVRRLGVAGHGWYDVALRGPDGFFRRLAGRIETGADSFSDPLMGGQAVMRQT